MSSKKVNSILKDVLEKVNPPEEDIKLIEKELEIFLKSIKERIKKKKIDAEIFVGGSFAKKTIIKKDCYDVDVFIRFDKKYGDKKISALTKDLLKGFKKVSVIHGSRDYFRIDITPYFFIELIPVIKVKKPKEAENITDLSYSHVKYINKKAKSEKILNEIRLAKAFCYAKKCYGAESYIKGFSGYGLELLIIYYKSFMKFVREMSKAKEQIIIDIEKLHKNRNYILMDLNSSKLKSPIVLIDPTYKQRNALAALSEETLNNFKKECKKFLKNPSEKHFEIEKIDLEKIKKDAKKRKQEFILLEVKTDKQKGDVAGSKLLKFYNYLESELSKFFEINKKGFNYNGIKSARYFFVLSKKKEILFSGPFLVDKKNVAKFKKEHKKNFKKKGRIYAKEKINFTTKSFMKKFLVKNKKQIKEMYISDVNVLN